MAHGEGEAGDGFDHKERKLEAGATLTSTSTLTTTTMVVVVMVEPNQRNCDGGDGLGVTRLHSLLQFGRLLTNVGQLL